jgi:hypothetical protein
MPPINLASAIVWSTRRMLFFYELEMESQSDTQFECACMNIIMISISRLSDIIGTGHHGADWSMEIDFPYRIDNQQFGIALVALRIEIQRVYGGKVFALITFPCEYAVIVGMENETAEIMEFHKRLGLHRETAAHVVVAVYHIVIVALGAAQQDCTEEYTLFQTRQRAYTGKENITPGPNEAASDMR